MIVHMRMLPDLNLKKVSDADVTDIGKLVFFTSVTTLWTMLGSRIYRIFSNNYNGSVTGFYALTL